MNKNPDEKKICVICEICVTKKRPKKNLCKSVKSVGQKTPMKKSV